MVPYRSRKKKMDITIVAFKFSDSFVKMYGGLSGLGVQKFPSLQESKEK